MDFIKADTARCLDANGGNPACNQGSMAVIEGMEQDHHIKGMDIKRTM